MLRKMYRSFSLAGTGAMLVDMVAAPARKNAEIERLLLICFAQSMD